MLQQTRTDIVLIRALLDEVIPHMEAHPKQVNLDSYRLTAHTFDLLRGCRTTYCLLGWAVQFDAFKPYISRHLGEIAWTPTRHRIEQAMRLEIPEYPLFGQRMSGGTLEKRKRFLADLYLERV